MGQRLMTDYIKAYAGTLSPDQCQTLIARFEADGDRHEAKGFDGGFSFVQLDVTKHWPDVHAVVDRIVQVCSQQYQNALGLAPYWPTTRMQEHIRLKRYMPGGRDQFPPHVDVMDQAAAARFCTAIIYLNAPGGGETVFPELGVVMPPEPGKLIMFPPLWTFPHAGLPPRDRPKYILHAYLWYSPAGEVR